MKIKRRRTRDKLSDADHRKNCADGAGGLGLCLLGEWRECDAMLNAYKSGSIVVEESDFCEKVGCAHDQLEDYLRSNWHEHSIFATMDGSELVHKNNLSLVKQRGHYFTVRLFSPLNPGLPMVHRLREESVSPRRM